MSDNGSSGMTAIVAIVAILLILGVGYFVMQNYAGNDGGTINVDLPDGGDGQ